MALFTGTPVEVSPTPFLWNNVATGKQGPWHFDGDLYLPGLTPIADIAGDDGVARSEDSGTTWSTVYNGINGEGTYLSSILDEANEKIVFLLFRGTPHYDLRTFSYNLITQTFTTATSLSLGASTTLSPGGTHGHLVLRPNGEVWAVYSTAVISGGGIGIYAVEILADAFGTPIELDTVDGSEFFRARAAIADDDNVIHIAYHHTSPNELLHITLESDNTPGIRDVASSSGGDHLLGNALIFQGQIVFLDQYVQPIRAYVGDALVSPDWTDMDIHSAVPFLSSGEACMVKEGDSSIKFLYQRHGFTDQDVMEIMLVDWDGSTLESPTVYWDLIANPPPSALAADPDDINTFAITADLTDNVLGVAVVSNADEFDDNHTLIYTSIVLSGIVPIGIPSEEAWGTPGDGPDIHPDSTLSEEAWGTPALVRPAVLPASITSGGAFGSPTLSSGPGGIGSYMSLH